MPAPKAISSSRRALTANLELDRGSVLDLLRPRIDPTGEWGLEGTISSPSVFPVSGSGRSKVVLCGEACAYENDPRLNLGLLGELFGVE